MILAFIGGHEYRNSLQYKEHTAIHLLTLVSEKVPGIRNILSDGNLSDYYMVQN